MYVVAPGMLTLLSKHAVRNAAYKRTHSRMPDGTGNATSKFATCPAWENLLSCTAGSYSTIW